MKFISAKDTADFLSQSAPRVWVHRMLKWMIFFGELDAHVDRVTVQPYASVFEFTAELYEIAKEFSGPAMDDAIRSKYPPEIAEKLVGKAHGDRFDDEKYFIEGWEEIGPLDTGFIMFASDVNWDAGTIQVEWIDNEQLANDILFPRQDFIGSEFEKPSFELQFEGLKFEANKIELLLPNAALEGVKELPGHSSRRSHSIGRPTKWNWDGAMAFVVSQAQTPDGLPSGDGAQARIEEMMADWFTESFGDCPAASQIRQRAALVIKAIETPKKPKMT
jgi:hypothetical protein